MADLATLSRAWVRSPDYVELTPRQIALLGIITDEAGPHTVRSLAAAIGTSKPVITRAHSTLAEHGLLTQLRDPHDGRSITLVPTDKGMKLRVAIQDLAF